MSTHTALANLEMCTSMTILPFEGVKGLSLYLKGKESTKDLMLRDLKYGKEFCDVARKIFSSPAGAISENVFVYSGMQEVYQNEDARKEVVEKISKAGDVINSILNSCKPPIQEIRESIRTLEEITDTAEKNLAHLRRFSENYIFGNPVLV